ncbi:MULTISPECIES: indole-3-glycerol phosphate synthase TrpC [unclassified Curtobacterium]|uniref:indole-3-glycerol phosphate synthase TrpC n=1 Tax=unclassified Curtobacterium TaxID=257496 RepID=UPI000DA9165E|nr:MULTISPECIES: indole-3-glycerol phosphate synthase TrpC [unclassified Curtobacterium]PZE29023.1 indole-3-glycerol phosphate synthase TrpC [Curtobacterium sp. MCBD17_028]PZF59340.1 indole-3-glycerol phosphate synthase TrpC [Curtobacterium sp. MCBD17_034]PZF65407.1 indole-3-glycerol phosphate synthase TrpC [Curtobacterium sp. MCBD17_013]PZM34392.1 indole-3-glycerol phosphate synthase TrpC [Curtobacterium sp. MCBD17_031]WIB65151.1 indole-3-glycerol phosphate synthase TrpC [Curtobacterium sp. M
MLAGLVAGALEDAAARRLDRPAADVERDLDRVSSPRDALAFLAPGDRVHVIAEVKRASPSRGPLAEIADPAELASRYEAGGASAISVLTEGRRFRGSLADLEAVRARVAVPVLRKDFIADPYQVLEARASGADIVLLIVAALDQPRLVELHTLVEQLGMRALVEAHSADEVSRGLDAGARILGVNARDLTDFSLDRDLFGRLVGAVPDGVVRVAESAVSSPADVAHYRAAGADAVLVGEALVTGDDPAATLAAFRVV